MPSNIKIISVTADRRNLTAGGVTGFDDDPTDAGGASNPSLIAVGTRPFAGFRHHTYLDAYPDVAWGNTNPLVHYLQYGIHEGRHTFADGVWG